MLDFHAENGWTIAQDEGSEIVQVIGPTGTVMNLLQPGADVALGEFYTADFERVERVEDGRTGDAGGPIVLDAEMIGAGWIGRRVRVQVSPTVTVEDVLIQVTHQKNTTWLWFENTKNGQSVGLAAIFGNGEGYNVGHSAKVEFLT